MYIPSPVEKGPSTSTKGKTVFALLNKIRRGNLIQGTFTHMNEYHKHKQSLALNTLRSKI